MDRHTHTQRERERKRERETETHTHRDAQAHEGISSDIVLLYIPPHTLVNVCVCVCVCVWLKACVHGLRMCQRRCVRVCVIFCLCLSKCVKVCFVCVCVHVSLQHPLPEGDSHVPYQGDVACCHRCLSSFMPPSVACERDGHREKWREEHIVIGHRN